MRVFFSGFFLIAFLIGCKGDDDAVELSPPANTCANAGPLRLGADTSFFLLPNSFTPNTDGKNDFFGAVSKGVDSVDFSMKVQDGNNVVFETSNPNDQWVPTGYGKTRVQLTVDVRLRTLSGVTFDTCMRLVIPRLDTARNCWINLDGLHFFDEIDALVGQFVYPTAEWGCL